ncbi:uncharacterized protein LOC133910211 [Phragmites australis]|uniref:uncharacterized protein LOC133910211 n=1 Tax=Phragmites australis TaxID=29695 RepID=UPI002D778E96|nr:uncharacterized protein LOC133910211 [Phragmites australis]
MSYWNSRSYLGAQSGNNQQDGYGGGQQYEATSGKKRSSSRLKKSSGSKKADDGEEYPNYTANNNGSHADADDKGRYNRNGNYNSNTSNDYSGGAKAYNGSAVGSPYYGGGGGVGVYGNNSPYGNGGDVYVPYNAPAAFWAPQDGTRSPMYISTKEVHVYAVPGSQNENDNDQKRRGGGGGFFGPAFQAVGHFFDRRFGFQDRN